MIQKTAAILENMKIKELQGQIPESKKILYELLNLASKYDNTSSME